MIRAPFRVMIAGGGSPAIALSLLGVIPGVEIVPTLLEPSTEPPPHGAVVILPSLDDLDPELCLRGVTWTAEERRGAGSRAIERLSRLLAAWANRGAPVLVGMILPPAELPLYDPQLPDGVTAMVQRINLALLKLASERLQFYAFPYSEHKLPQTIARVVGTLLRPALKMLVVDADGVLWDGIVGEVGIENISPHTELTYELLRLRSEGVLIALVSKNERADVEAAFERHFPHFPLDRFCTVRIDWRAKPEHVAEIAEEFGIALDAVAFVDDQPFEREAMTYHHPSVRILRLEPFNAATLTAEIRRSGWFERLRLTDEDRARSKHFAGNVERAMLERDTQDPEKFLHALGLTVRVNGIEERDMPRVVDLFGKTNQLNLTVRRHGEATLRMFLSDPHVVALKVSVADRFGDQGIVGVMIALLNPESGLAELDTFLMSCRVIGRGVEGAMWSALLDKIQVRGARELRTTYRPTGRNAQVASLFERFGCEITEQHADETHYRIMMDGAVPAPGWIDLHAD